MKCGMSRIISAAKWRRRRHFGGQVIEVDNDGIGAVIVRWPPMNASRLRRLAGSLSGDFQIIDDLLLINSAASLSLLHFEHLDCRLA